MNNQESEFTKEQFIDIFSRLQKEIKSCDYNKSNNSIGTPDSILIKKLNIYRLNNFYLFLDLDKIMNTVITPR